VCPCPQTRVCWACCGLLRVCCLVSLERALFVGGEPSGSVCCCAGDAVLYGWCLSGCLCGICGGEKALTRQRGSRALPLLLTCTGVCCQSAAKVCLGIGVWGPANMACYCLRLY
jgi:hypothetical protein